MKNELVDSMDYFDEEDARPKKRGRKPFPLPNQDELANISVNEKQKIERRLRNRSSKQASRERQKTAAHLAAQVKELTAENAKLNAALKRKTEEIGLLKAQLHASCQPPSPTSPPSPTFGGAPPQHTSDQAEAHKAVLSSPSPSVPQNLPPIAVPPPRWATKPTPSPFQANPAATAIAIARVDAEEGNFPVFTPFAPITTPRGGSNISLFDSTMLPRLSSFPPQIASARGKVGSPRGSHFYPETLIQSPSAFSQWQPAAFPSELLHETPTAIAATTAVLSEEITPSPRALDRLMSPALQCWQDS